MKVVKVYQCMNDLVKFITELVKEERENMVYYSLLHDVPLYLRIFPLHNAFVSESGRETWVDWTQCTHTFEPTHWKHVYVEGERLRERVRVSINHVDKGYPAYALALTRLTLAHMYSHTNSSHTKRFYPTDFSFHNILSFNETSTEHTVCKYYYTRISSSPSHTHTCGQTTIHRSPAHLTF